MLKVSRRLQSSITFVLDSAELTLNKKELLRSMNLDQLST
ncbi:hypothetical protein LEP1GSC151_0963 [Leptospira interrogans serovar Grippotyphosa str. LT2186]|uniref:Uncharacterized protein n=2 Tax=Leptospira interrogans TaxID=173 RepID=M3FYM2_LEPIR|nr:hypothetical protein LEP1GSC045_0463 [Leptospira interrogans serovar Pomona str. Kennewicki LC82-25]EKN95916.1 hypothetical protein LEP1GSC014_4402 [Leptospira interrogans serovar Pomona str. Pomona]EKR37439.1 hypothetical protein LEP1GSC096_1523 [Leptospira interrogans serovar Hebdomadis str. R499]EKR44500.1 hypothetical protein LEP1GSC097_2604 [Leptospira interrogans serovar Grippotyphosa str. UI 08368]EKR82013.1 hypothetical protein LEP1GSC099_2552 [Leptospira interrogans str. UI 08452]E